MNFSPGAQGIEFTEHAVRLPLRRQLPLTTDRREADSKLAIEPPI